MRPRLAACLVLVLGACTEQSPAPAPPGSPRAAPSPEPVPPPVATVRLVASDDPSLTSYLEGLRFAADEVNAGGSVQLRILDAPSVQSALGLDPQAVVVVGDPSDVAASRSAIEASRTPVLMIGGDLYSSRLLHRYVFQTATPYRWQARVTAKYLVADRGYTSIAVLLDAALGDDATAWVSEALAEEGATPTFTAEVGAGTSAAEAVSSAVAAGAQAILYQGSTAQATEVSRAVSELTDPPQLALSSDALDATFVTENQAPPGTVASYTYAWSGWADMLPRIHSFRERFADAYEHYPVSLEQEGYDAMMALGEALARTGGEGGDALVTELERFREETYASVPVRLGPDDHVLAEESHLGLFAVEDPGIVFPEGEASSLLSWRPVLRTFTTDGEKVNFLDRDKKVFFPFWQPKRPTPKYWRSEFGIISRSSDPLH